MADLARSLKLSRVSVVREYLRLIKGEKGSALLYYASIDRDVQICVDKSNNDSQLITSQ